MSVSSPDRVVFPAAGVTKRELAEHYRRVAELALPHVAGRPLALVRCPEGIEAECFFQKHPFEGMPKAIEAVRVKGEPGAQPHTLVRDTAGLVSLAQIGVIEIHGWGSRLPELEAPDQLIFDLDPGPGVGWEDVVRGAVEVRDLLAELRLTSFVKTTGGKGLHVVVPVAPKVGWGEAKRFCKAVAQNLRKTHPGRYTAALSKSKRGGKIFVDYLRNDRGATAVAAYSVRARPGAPVAMPIAWEELDELPSSAAWGVRDVAARLDSVAGADPWAEVTETRQVIPTL